MFLFKFKFQNNNWTSNSKFLFNSTNKLLTYNPIIEPIVFPSHATWTFFIASMCVLLLLDGVNGWIQSWYYSLEGETFIFNSFAWRNDSCALCEPIKLDNSIPKITYILTCCLYLHSHRFFRDIHSYILYCNKSVLMFLLCTHVFFLSYA